MSTTDALAALARYPIYDTVWLIVVPFLVGVLVFLCSIPAIVAMAFRDMRRENTRTLGTMTAIALLVVFFGNVANFAVVVHRKELHDEAQSIQAGETCAVALAGIRSGSVRSTTVEQDAALDRLCRRSPDVAREGTSDPDRMRV